MFSDGCAEDGQSVQPLLGKANVRDRSRSSIDVRGEGEAARDPCVTFVEDNTQLSLLQALDPYWPNAVEEMNWARDGAVINVGKEMNEGSVNTEYAEFVHTVSDCIM